jgi:hypothetical protein
MTGGDYRIAGRTSTAIGLVPRTFSSCNLFRFPFKATDTRTFRIGSYVRLSPQSGPDPNLTLCG